MSYIPVAFFSKVLKPGEPAEIELDEASALITSVTYGEEVSGSKRSALSLTYIDRMAEPEEEINEKEDEDEDDDSDASFNTHAVMRKTVVASLIPGKIENASINVILNSSEAYELSVTGDNEVHVTGQYVFFPNDAQDDEEDSEDDYDSEIGSDEDLDPAEFGEYDPETGLLGGEITGMDQEGDSEDDDEEDDARFEELKDESPKKAASEKKQIAGGDVSMDADASGVSAADTSKLSKNQKKKLKKAEKQQEEGAEKAADIALKATAEEPAAPASDAKKAETASAASETKKPSRKQTLPSGLVIEDAKVGKGPAAKKGQMLSMRYIGKLANGKVFDSNTKGNPFKFKFGTGEVIKGWDEGMKGMSAGGERKLVIPASLAYGKKGVDGIPGGASLHFDVKLLSIK